MSFLTLPGLIDPHVHLRDPGQTHKEDFATGTAAALNGGYTTILDMPNNKEPITTSARLKEKMAIAKEKILCDVGFYFGSLGNNLTEFPKVREKVLGLKLYLNETTGNYLIDKGSLEKTFLAWPDGEKRVKSMSLRSSILLSRKPILVHAENDAVEFVIGLVRKTRNRVHVCHISTKSDLVQIVKAKAESLPITCGVTPHHLFLTEHDAKRLGPFGIMKPPLRSQRNVDFLWKHLKAIDVVESDHAPHTIEEKQSDNPPYGVPGLETTLSLLLTAVGQKRLAIEDVIRLCHTNPARIFGIKTDKRTRVGVDLHKSYIIHGKSLFTKCGWSPFEGMRVRGKVRRVFLRGHLVYKDGNILGKPKGNPLRLLISIRDRNS